MFRSVAVIWFMGWHYVANTAGRAKYRIDNKELDEQTKKEYTAQIYKMTQSFSKGMIKASGSKMIVTGKENLPKSGGNLYMANHMGMFDPIVMASTIDDPCIYIGKDDVGKIPIIKTWFEAIGSLNLDPDFKKHIQDDKKHQIYILSNLKCSTEHEMYRMSFSHSDMCTQCTQNTADDYVHALWL